MRRAIDFREKQESLRHRLDRLPERTLVRRRLERELRGLVVDELQREVTPDLKPVPEYAEDEGQPLKYFQK